MHKHGKTIINIPLSSSLSRVYACKKVFSKLVKAFVIPNLITILKLILQFFCLVSPLADDTTLAQFRHNLQISANYLKAGRGKNILVHYVGAGIRLDFCLYRISPTNFKRFTFFFAQIEVS